MDNHVSVSNLYIDVQFLREVPNHERKQEDHLLLNAAATDGLANRLSWDELKSSSSQGYLSREWGLWHRVETYLHKRQLELQTKSKGGLSKIATDVLARGMVVYPENPALQRMSDEVEDRVGDYLLLQLDERSEQNPYMRMAVVSTLVNLSRSSYNVKLASALKNLLDPDFESVADVRKKAAEELASFVPYDLEAFQIMVGQLDVSREPSPNVRQTIVEGLAGVADEWMLQRLANTWFNKGRMDLAEAIEVLLSHLDIHKEPDENVRLAVVNAVGILGTRVSTRRVMNKLTNIFRENMGRSPEMENALIASMARLTDVLQSER